MQNKYDAKIGPSFDEIKKLLRRNQYIYRTNKLHDTVEQNAYKLHIYGINEKDNEIAGDKIFYQGEYGDSEPFMRAMNALKSDLDIPFDIRAVSYKKFNKDKEEALKEKPPKIGCTGCNDIGIVWTFHTMIIIKEERIPDGYSKRDVGRRVPVFCQLPVDQKFKDVRRCVTFCSCDRGRHLYELSKMKDKPRWSNIVKITHKNLSQPMRDAY